MTPADDLDPIWRALASPTRREILDLLRERPMATGEIVLAFPGLSRFAVMQHLGVLEKAGLLVAHKSGRQRLNHLNAVPLRLIQQRWLKEYEPAWSDSLIDLKRRLEPPTSPGAEYASSPVRRRAGSRTSPERMTTGKPARSPAKRSRA